MAAGNMVPNEVDIYILQSYLISISLFSNFYYLLLVDTLTGCA